MKYSKENRKNMTWEDAKWFCLSFGLEINWDIRGVNVFDIADALCRAFEAGKDYTVKEGKE